MPIVSVKHPSYFYKKLDEKQILGITKMKLRRILTANQMFPVVGTGYG
jgi:hypothetical protein